MHSRAALACAIGTSIAHSTKHVPAELFAGVTDTPEEAAELAFKVNVERDKAAFAARAARGPMGVLGGR